MSVRAKDKEYLIQNMTMLLDSGMDILSALVAIREEMKNPEMKKVVTTMISQVDEGTPLWRVLENNDVLPGPSISIIRIGEKSGRLVANLGMIAEQQAKAHSLRSKIRSALMYPVIVLVLTGVIGIGIAWFILPKLADIFTGLDMELPIVTKLLIDFGLYLSDNGKWVIPLGLIILSTIFYLVFLYKKTNFIGHWILFHMPVIRDMVLQVEMARFGHILGELLDAELPIVDAIQSLAHATTFGFYKKIYLHIVDSIADGNSFQKTFESIPRCKRFIPRFIQQIIIAGEQSGHLPEALMKVGQTYEEKTDETTRNLTVLLEPIMLIVIWVGVIGVAMSVILPIYSLIGNLND